MVNKRYEKLGSQRSVIRELFEYGNLRAREIGKENVYDFSLGNPNVPAPDCVQSEIKRLVEEIPPEVLHGYTSASGLTEVREAVAQYIKTQFGAPMSAQYVYMTCGASASLVLTLSALIEEEGEEVVAIAPFFPEYAVFVESAGGKLVTAYTDETFHLDLASLDRAIGKNTKAVLVNSPNNPTGAVYGLEELKGLAALLTRKSKEKGAPIFLVADEPYRELTYGYEVPYLPCLYPDTVVCYSFSKSLSLAGERLGYVAVSPECENAEALYNAVCGAGRSHGYVCAPALFQRVCAACLGKSSDVNAYAKNGKRLYDFLTQAGFTCIQPQGAFYLFMKTPEDAVKFTERAKKYELLLVPSDTFGVKGYVRISYCVAASVIERSLPAFRKLADEYFRS